MAIFGNFKGTTQSEFQIGKSTNGTKISTGTQPSSNQSAGDLWLDSANSTIEVYHSGAWKNIGVTLPTLNVDSGTLFVDSTNDTVSIGSTSSNDKLFVNGSLRLGTNPSLKHSGAYLDVSHTNGSATQLRVRDNSSSGSDPIFKVFNANNTSEVFKVTGSTMTMTSADAGSSASPEFTLYRNSASPADADYLGQIKFNGENDAGQETVYAKITGKILDASDGSEDGIIEFANKKAGTNTITARLRSDSLQLLNGTSLVVGGVTYPTSDGSANQILQTDGSGTLSFVDNSATPGGSNTQIQFNDSGSFGGHANLTYDSSTETLGTTNLSVTNFTYSVLSEDYGLIGETTTTTKDYGDITDEASGDFLNDVVEDTTPQLGGDLDAQNNNITNVGVATAKSYKDTVYTITDGASVDIEPDNGGIQVWTLGANRTATANSFDAGAKVMLMIDDGSGYTVTWPSVNWVGGVAPTLVTSGYSIIELWKVGSQLYGAFAGGVA